jgi:protein-disulfide isomerase
MQKGFWALVAVLVVAMIGIFIYTGDDDEESAFQTYDPTELQLTDHIYGLTSQPQTIEELKQAATGKAIVMEYADFQCPACRNSFVDVNKLRTEFEDDMLFVFRHFPIVSAHPNAMAAHRAAVAAEKQGQFWEMHDLLYLRQNTWAVASNPVEVFRGYAQELGLDVERYDSDVADPLTYERINVDVESSRALGVNSTPTMFVDFEQVELPTYENLVELIGQSLAEVAQ